MTALEEYVAWCNGGGDRDRVDLFDGWLHADAAIAELQAARDHTIVVLNDCQAEMGRQCARADEAEAALAKVLEPKPFPQCPNKQCADWARLTSKNRDGWDERARKAEAKLAAVEEERDRLECCGNCGHVQHYTFDGEPRMCCRHPDSPYLECDVTADFACNRWSARLTGKEGE